MARSARRARSIEMTVALLGVSGVIALLGSGGCGFPGYQFSDGDASVSDDASDATGLADATNEAGGGDGSASDTSTSDSTLGTEAAAPDAATDAPRPIDARPTGPPPTKCSPSTSAAACSYLPPAPTGMVIDGDGSDMCTLPERAFLAKDAPAIDPASCVPPERVSVRAGVDAVGVHVFVQVLDDPALVIAPGAGSQSFSINLRNEGLASALLSQVTQFFREKLLVERHLRCITRYARDPLC